MLHVKNSYAALEEPDEEYSGNITYLIQEGNIP